MAGMCSRCLTGLLSPRCLWALVASFSLSACLFPVIDFESHSAPQHVAYRSLQPRSAAQPSAPPAPQPMAASRPLAASVIAGPKPKSEPTKLASHAPAVARSTQVAQPIPEPVRIASEEACYKALWREGVSFNMLPRASAPGVPWPIRLKGEVHGVSFEQQDHSPQHAILDCRLAMALSAWAPQLRRAGVKRVEYYSMYRPGARIAGSGGVSGHAHGMAIDAARFALQNGKTADVLEDWEGRTRGEAPCPLRSDEAREARLLRSVTCSAAERKLFQVVLTPHYNHAHDNHVHLEVKPDVNWTYVR